MANPKLATRPLWCISRQCIPNPIKNKPNQTPNPNSQLKTQKAILNNSNTPTQQPPNSTNINPNPSKRSKPISSVFLRLRSPNDSAAVWLLAPRWSCSARLPARAPQLLSHLVVMVASSCAVNAGGSSKSPPYCDSKHQLESSNLFSWLR